MPCDHESFQSYAQRLLRRNMHINLGKQHNEPPSIFIPVNDDDAESAKIAIGRLPLGHKIESERGEIIL